ncbi:YncE family protein [Nocardia tengchongensis]|uniref:YncE family protein n=1 Tax=Nocardia tengchongensis TaxID=2055889 RepID=UPI0036BF46AC
MPSGHLRSVRFGRMCFTSRLFGGIGLVAAVMVAVTGCGSASSVSSSPVTHVTTTEDPATNRDFDDLGVGPYRSYGTVEVGRGPRGVAVDPALHHAYVVNQDATTAPYPVSISVLDTRNRTVTATIFTDGLVVREPQPIVIDPATHLVYVLGIGGSGALAVIDPTTNSVVARIAIEDVGDPTAVAIDSDRHRVYVAGQFDQKIAAIDTGSRAVVATVAVGAKPAALAVDPLSHQVWVATAAGASVIDPDPFVVSATIAAAGEPEAVVIDSDSHTAYLTEFRGHSVTLVDTATHAVSRTSLNRESSFAVALDPALHTVFLTSGAFDSITMIDTRTQQLAASRRTAHQYSDGHWTGGIAVDATTHEIYVTHGEHSRTIEILAPA